MRISTRPLSSVSTILLCLMFFLTLSYCCARVQGSSVGEERIDSASHFEANVPLIRPIAVPSIFCKCLQRHVHNPQVCCTCERLKCKCWNKWWQNSKRYGHHPAFNYCNRLCRRRCWRALLDMKDLWWQILQVERYSAYVGDGLPSRSYKVNQLGRTNVKQLTLDFYDCLFRE